MFKNTLQIVTGEKLQNIADIFIGNDDNFNYNPNIANMGKHKFRYLSDLKKMDRFDNPRTVYCYGDLISEFADIIHIFKNPFVLITHNSDRNMNEEPIVLKILRYPLLIRWHGQNINYIHEKLFFLPIGVANSQWQHGNLQMYKEIFDNYDLNAIKSKMFYFNFKVETNFQARSECYNIINRWNHSKREIDFLPMVHPMENLQRLAQYKYCFCPEGNGKDTHRLWECFYLQVVPIVIRNTFTEKIKSTTGLPMILLDSWYDFDNIYTALKENYHNFDFDSKKEYISINHYVKEIIS